jgi:hypothetical protein
MIMKNRYCLIGSGAEIWKWAGTGFNEPIIPKRQSLFAVLQHRPILHQANLITDSADKKILQMHWYQLAKRQSYGTYW